MTATANVLRWWLATLLAPAFIATAAPAQTLESAKKALRMDALRLMGAGLKVPSIAAYCEKNVESNLDLMEAAKEWNKRHDELLKKAIRVIEWSGGMSAGERGLYDRFAYRLLKSEFEDQSSKAVHCRETLAAIKSGDMELEKNPVTAEAARHIVAATLE